GGKFGLSSILAPYQKPNGEEQHDDENTSDPELEQLGDTSGGGLGRRVHTANLADAWLGRNDVSFASGSRPERVLFEQSQLAPQRNDETIAAMILRDREERERCFARVEIELEPREDDRLLDLLRRERRIVHERDRFVRIGLEDDAIAVWR